VPRHERAYPVRVGLGVLAQRPADRLAEEEVAVLEVRPDGVGEQLGVGRLLETDL